MSATGPPRCADAGTASSVNLVTSTRAAVRALVGTNGPIPRVQGPHSRPCRRADLDCTYRAGVRIAGLVAVVAVTTLGPACASAHRSTSTAAGVSPTTVSATSVTTAAPVASASHPADLTK